MLKQLRDHLSMYKLCYQQKICIIEYLFQSCQSTMFARHDWSPNGSELIVPCASNNGGPTAQILLRNKDWNNSRDLVGHRRAVTCVVYDLAPNNIIKCFLAYLFASI